MFRITRRTLNSKWHELTQFTGDSYLQSMMGHGLQATSNSELIDKLASRGFLQLQYKPMLDQMKSVDRAKFIPSSVPRELAYCNQPHKLTRTHAMSTPQFHAQIISLISSRLGPGRTTAEVGCGSGYIPAVMGAFGCRKVFAVEKDSDLFAMAKSNLGSYKNVDVVKELPDHTSLDALYISAFFDSLEHLVQFIEGFQMNKNALVVAAIVDPPLAPDQQLVLLEWNGIEWTKTDLFRVLCEPLIVC